MNEVRLRVVVAEGVDVAAQAVEKVRGLVLAQQGVASVELDRVCDR